MLAWTVKRNFVARLVKGLFRSIPFHGAAVRYGTVR